MQFFLRMCGPLREPSGRAAERLSIAYSATGIAPGQKDIGVAADWWRGARLSRWAGGMVPLGYELKDGKRYIVEEEAEQIRTIFKQYLVLGSVNRLVLELRER